MAAALEGLGFQVHSLLDADVSSMEQAILDFGDRLRDGGVGLFYYAGHGVQAQGSNYLIPLQANISREIQLKRKAIDAGLVLDAMGAAIMASISSSSTPAAIIPTRIAFATLLAAWRAWIAPRVAL